MIVILLSPIYGSVYFCKVQRNNKEKEIAVHYSFSPNLGRWTNLSTLLLLFLDRSTLHSKVTLQRVNTAKKTQVLHI